MTELEAFAVELSLEAARTALPYFRGDNAEENKAGPGAFDPVTEADRAAEAAIRRLIAARYPHHGVIGEEYGEDYGVWGEKSMYGKTFLGITRATFLIDATGRVVQVWPKVSVKGHADEVLAAARAL